MTKIHFWQEMFIRGCSEASDLYIVKSESSLYSIFFLCANPSNGHIAEHKLSSLFLEGYFTLEKEIH